MNYYLRYIFFCLVIYFCLLSNSIAFTLKIIGNKNISKDTIVEIINFNSNQNYNENNINNFQKKLFETGFFKKINFKVNNNILTLIVDENPLIDFYYIEGVESDKILDIFTSKLQLGQNKIFSENLLKSDLNFINNFFKSQGYLDIEVKPILRELPNNLVNLIIQIDKKNKYRINNIYFIGNNKFSNSTLRNVISSSEHGWWKFLSDNTTLSNERIDYDKFRLKKFYLDNGYFDIQISSASVEILKNYKSNITFSLNSGIKYNFGKINIIDKNNNLNKINREYIEKLSSEIIYKEYSVSKLEKLKKLLYEYLRQNSIEFVTLYDIPNKNNNVINIDLVFENKDRQFVNLINVTGNSITEEKVIRDKLRLVEGDSYLSYKLEKSKRDLENSGIFKSVTTEIEKVPNQKELINLNLKVEEQPTGSISAGAGIGSAGSEVNANIQEINLFGKGITLRSGVTVGTQKVYGNILVKLPDFQNSGNELINNLYVRSTDYENTGYESKKIGNDLSTNYYIYEDISLNIGIGLDLDKINTSSNSNALLRSRDGSYSTYKTFYSIKNDKRNRKFNTTEGHLVGFKQTLAVPGSDIQYLNNDLWSSYYYPLSDNYILSFKSGIETINALNGKDIKLSDRVFLSSNNLKGFENRGVGPFDANDHVGGNYSAYASISSSFPNGLPEKWNANTSLFVNAGNVWGVDYDSSKDSDKIRSAFGVSLDWISPLGPLNFVFSETISKASTDKPQSFAFQIGSAF